jgi:hypothetical protein
VQMLHVPSDHIWRPDIVLYNKWVLLHLSEALDVQILLSHSLSCTR